jgi:hypothetical protein
LPGHATYQDRSDTGRCRAAFDFEIQDLLRVMRDSRAFRFEYAYVLRLIDELEALNLVSDRLYNPRIDFWVPQHRHSRATITFMQTCVIRMLEEQTLRRVICPECNDSIPASGIRVAEWGWSNGPLASAGGRTLTCAAGHLLLKTTEMFS